VPTSLAISLDEIEVFLSLEVSEDISYDKTVQLIEFLVGLQCDEIEKAAVAAINDTSIEVTAECSNVTIISTSRRLQGAQTSLRMLQGVTYDVQYSVVIVYYCPPPSDCIFSSEDAARQVLNDTSRLNDLLKENNITGVDLNTANLTVVKRMTPGPTPDPIPEPTVTPSNFIGTNTFSPDSIRAYTYRANSIRADTVSAYVK
jgi:hypothetical protein